ncbi:MAG: HAD-IA family hydrolase [Gammaproteobacteria bacterium]|nr:HAD-IA family hydrolase [Gammaproteobacteria bacterium]NIM73497.1 HAD-IA family hydrolase [Gammaproteobacteria bacterium]NIN39906.1 HAD-IA family hydrolase [Gammaproteobacteria bacterium]NIO25306.1 HAD-IA family hydrolase [Gammaproteobacteria bacterium]NIO65933.1 HAD-IA family hydrolase [Gammaproteobacteria bacterium]
MNGACAPGTIFFDLDGTLADTLPDLSAALGEALAEHGLAPVADEILRPLVSRGARAMAEIACDARLDAPTLDEVLARFLALYGENVCRHTTLVEGMAPLLDALEARGIVWGIVTNKRRAYTEPLMRALDPQARAACIVSGDSTANAKPHPQPLLHACRLAGSRPAECVYVGDAEKDVVAARRAGMRCVAATWGYIAADDDPLDWHADATIDAPADLLDWLDRF